MLQIEQLNKVVVNVLPDPSKRIKVFEKETQITKDFLQFYTKENACQTQITLIDSKYNKIFENMNIIDEITNDFNYKKDFQSLISSYVKKSIKDKTDFKFESHLFSLHLDDFINKFQDVENLSESEEEIVEKNFQKPNKHQFSQYRVIIN